MPYRIDPNDVPEAVGTLYPSPFDQPCRERTRRRLGNAAGLTQFGVNLLTLPPGSWSSQRHWHSHEDEFVFVLSGEVVLVTDAGEEVLRAGEAAGFKAGVEDGHCLRNVSDAVATALEVGTRVPENAVDYPDIDMRVPPYGKPAQFVHRDGTPYPDQPRRGPAR